MAVSVNRTPPIRVMTIPWTSASDGTASVTTPGTEGGEIYRIVTVPGSGGSAPTDQYDLVLNDVDGVDVANGLIANRSATNTEAVYPAFEISLSTDKYARPSMFAGVLTLAVSNAGSAKSGTVRVYYR